MSFKKRFLHGIFKIRAGKSMEYQILIVDDDKDLSWIIAEMLQDYGYKVLCAADVSWRQLS